MKISYIIGLVVIAVAFAAIFSMNTDASAYVSFKQAWQMAQEGDERKLHVVGKVARMHGQLAMEYNPQADPNYFKFQLVDNENETKEVVYLNPKPQDFERSEQIVVVGSAKGNTFLAEKIYMKCPSKYQNEEFHEAGTKGPTASAQ